MKKLYYRTKFRSSKIPNSISLLILLICSFNAFSQSLADKSVNSFFQSDSEGNLWISSLNAWNKFNGVSTTIYHDNDLYGINGSFIQSSMFEDFQGNLWSSTYEYLIRYAPRLDDFSSFQVKVDDTLGTKEYHVIGMLDNRKTLIVKIHNKIIHVDTDNLKTNYESKIRTNSKRFILDFSEDSLVVGLPWSQGKGFELFQLRDNQYQLQGSNLNSNTEYRDGIIVDRHIFLVSKDAIEVFGIQKGSSQVIRPHKNFMPFHIVKFEDRLLLTAGDDGVWVLDPKSLEFKGTCNVQDGLMDNSPVEIYVDENNFVWLSFRKHGVQKINFETINRKDTFRKHSTESVSRLAKNTDYLIKYLYNNRLELTNFGSGVVKEFLIPSKFPFRDLKLYGDTLLEIITTKDFYSIKLPEFTYKDHKTNDNGQYYFLERGKDRSDFITSSQSLLAIDTSKEVVDCYENDNILMHNLNGEVLYLSNSHELHYCNKSNTHLYQNIGLVSDIHFEKSNNRYLISSTTGLYSLSRTDLELRSILPQILYGPVSGFAADKNGGLWITSQNQLFIGSDSNLVRIPTDTELEFSNSPPVFANDEVWFATNKGVYSVPKDIYKYYDYKPNLFLKEIFMNNISHDTGINPDYVENLKFNYLENDLVFRFEVGEFKGDSSRLVRHKLHNYDDEWTTSSTFDIKYNNVPPGKYNLEIYGVGSNRQESKPKSISIIITPPFYKSWWFLSLSILSLISIGFLINNARTRKIIKAKQIELDRQKALQSQRNRMSQDLHDEMGSGLTSIKYISNSIQETKDISKVSDIESTSNNLITSMRDLLWSLDESKDSLGVVLSKVRSTCNQMLQSTNLDYKIEEAIDKEVSISGIKRRNIILILKEAITNVLKHSEATTVSIILSQDATSLIFQIEDNGKGFDKDQISTQGYGLNSIRKRVKELNGKQEINSSGAGTILQFTIPIEESIG